MESYEDRLAAIEAEWREKYTDKEREQAAEAGEAMDGGSYPIKDEDDLKKAIKAIGRGNADHDAIRKHIMARAKALGLSKLIPENWNADGSLADEEEKAAACEGEDFRCSYSVEGDEVTLGDPEPVTAKTSYEPIQTNAARPRRKERRRAIPLMPEVRHWAIQPTSVEIRSAKNTDEAIITGSPIVYNADYTVFDMFGQFTERMAPGVASEVLKRGVDTRFLFNHDGLSLARTLSGTMTLQDGARSLDFEAHLDLRQQLANDLVIAIERRDITQMSVGFITARDEWDEAMEDRTVTQFADLLDVSAVTYPASPTTSIQIAQRMILAAPVESRARLRNFLVAERAGKVLSDASQGKVVSAIEALHSLYEAGGGNPADLIADDGEGGGSEETALAQDGTRSAEEGEPIRSVSASTLRLQLESRAKKRKPAKQAA